MIKITQEDFIEIHKCSLFQESNPILIARKINSIGTNAITNKAIDDLHKHWQERFHPFRVEYELPIELY